MSDFLAAQVRTEAQTPDAATFGYRLLLESGLFTTEEYLLAPASTS